MMFAVYMQLQSKPPSPGKSQVKGNRFAKTTSTQNMYAKGESSQNALQSHPSQTLTESSFTDDPLQALTRAHMRSTQLFPSCHSRNNVWIEKQHVKATLSSSCATPNQVNK